MGPDRFDDEAALVRAEKEWADAIRRSDRDALERLVADDYVLISARLGVMPRDEWMRVALEEYDIQEFSFDEVDVRVYRDVGVVNARYHQRARWEDQDLSVPFLLTDVWVRAGDAWRVVTRHSSIVAGAPSAGEGS